MITPIRTMKINDICQRKDDLLMSADDIEEIAKNVRAKAIDEFAEKIQWEYLNSCGLKQEEIDFLIAVSSMVAEQMKAGATNENSIIDEFANALKGRLTDAIHQKDVESMTNLINDVAREVKAGGKNE